MKDSQSCGIKKKKKQGHISKDRIERLVKNGISKHLNFTDFEICVDCIKVKQIKHTMKGVTSNSELLKIIHSDICENPIPYFTGQRYFTTSIKDVSHYGYVSNL